MGALHRGHQSLIRLAAEHGDEVFATVFVNPTQFGAGEDFEAYPRDLERDLGLAAEAGATAVFAPSAAEMYPSGEETRVVPGHLADGLCGASRPGHFTGVLTVVAKFFNLFPGATFVFGRKDYQQLQVVRRMAEDLLFPVRVLAHPIVREADGLALSSRNTYLTPAERARALGIARALVRANQLFLVGGCSAAELTCSALSVLREADLEVEYIALTDPETLELIPEDAPLPEECLLAIAARAGSTRLIDNLVLGRDEPPTLGQGP